MKSGFAVRSTLALTLAFAVLSLPSAAHATTGFAAEGDGIDLTRGLHLHFLPQSQLDQATGFLPKGQLADDPIDWPIALGQFALSAAINVGGLYAFTQLATPGAGWSKNAVKGQLITTGIIQFVTLPLASATGIYLVGEADELHDVSFGWPLLANYAAELVLVALKVGIDLGALQGTDIAQKGVDILSQFVAIDYVLHGLLPPIVTTYFSIRSRDAKGISFASLDRFVPETKSFADVHAESVLAVAQPVVAAVPVAVGRF